MVLVVVWALLCFTIISGFVAFVYAAIAIVKDVTVRIGLLAIIGAVPIAWGLCLVVLGFWRICPGWGPVKKALRQGFRFWSQEPLFLGDVEMLPLLGSRG